MKPVRMLVMVLSVALLSLGLAACGDDESDTKTVTVTAPAADDASTTAADKGTVVNVELGESGSTYFVKPDAESVKAGKVTFAVTNSGKLYHEFIVYSNTDDVEPGDLPVNKEDDKAELVEANIVGEAPYATPPIVPADKKPGDADHRIRSEGWGAELTVDLKAGKYILLCNLSGHYAKKQYTAFTAE